MTATPPDAHDPRATPTLRVGAVLGVTVTKWRRIWTDRFPKLSLELVDVAEADQQAALDEERVDMCFVRLPLTDARALHVIPLYEEVPVVVAPRDHPVAVVEEVSLAELAEEDLVEGFPAEVAMDLVAGGAGLLAVPQSVARSFSRRDLVYRPITDGTPTQIALAWLRENPHELIEEFIGIVRGRTVNSSRAPRPPAPAPDAPAKRAREVRRPGPAAHRPRRPRAR